MSINHPYREFENLKVWEVLSEGIEQLRSNDDLEEKTARAYIVGYLTKLLVESELLNEAGRATFSPMSKNI